ncbi:MAG TPA: DUF6226 family protein [Actinomycetota bacterium]|nr:DUF6226 family protein [Actinomycetota bacterium]
MSIARYLDEQGEPIPYGHRWGAQPPPEKMYSVVRHPQRFVPVVDLARTLIDYLSEHYQVNIIRDEEIALEPVAGAALRFQLEEGGEVTGVRIEAGLLAEELFPTCSCDACDDDVPQLLDDLEDFVFAVVQGDFAEWREGRWIHHGIYLGDTLTRSSGHKITDRGQWARVKPRAKELPGRYPAWPRR